MLVDIFHNMHMITYREVKSMELGLFSIGVEVGEPTYHEENLLGSLIASRALDL